VRGLDLDAGSTLHPCGRSSRRGREQLLIAGDLGDKRRWRESRARVAALPASYRSTVEALERYLTYAGVMSRGQVLVAMHSDLVEVFERAATDGTPVRVVVGEDPVEFAETFLRKYSDGQWIKKERDRLIEDVARAAGEDAR
jgi:DNA-binding ferritin-like protein (Dps family)